MITKDNTTETGKNFFKYYGQLKPNITTQHDDMTIELVEKGLGIGFAPKEYLTENCKIVELYNFKSFKFNIKLVYLNLDNSIVKLFNDIS